MNNNTLRKFLKNKKVIITGHTGFKGSWLALWLNLHLEQKYLVYQVIFLQILVILNFKLEKILSKK